MSSITLSVFDTELFHFSRILKQSLTSLGREALVRLDSRQACLCMSSQGQPEPGRWSSALRRAERVEVNPGPVESVRPMPAEDKGWVERAGHDPDAWSAYEIRFASGVVDQVALLWDGSQGEVLCQSVLRAIWAMLRESCLREFTGSRRAAADALLWTISHRFGSAVMVLDEHAHILQTNRVGADLLAERRLLRSVADGLSASTPSDTRALRRAVSECVAGQSGASEVILLIEDPDGPGRLPLSLTRFDGAEGASLVVLVVPQRPDPKRIEKLAQIMGLTPAEARVASLMQLGLPNREAALIAGLKEQTFNTYAKRVLSKLNVGCRAEAAQMLTWQAGLGLAS